VTGRPGGRWRSILPSVHNLHLRQLFADDPQRGERFTLEAMGLYFDYSKSRITSQTTRLLLELAEQSGLRQHIDAMFAGDKINITEQRAVLHVALRAPKGEQILADGVDVVPEVHAVLDKMGAFADEVRSGEWKGHTGKRVRNVVNIGIGGSDLGPVMAYEALKYYSQRDMTFRFVSNVDGTDFDAAQFDGEPGNIRLFRKSDVLRKPSSCASGPHSPALQLRARREPYNSGLPGHAADHGCGGASSGGSMCRAVPGRTSSTRVSGGIRVSEHVPA
jgi:hypothetical protein